MDFVLKVLSCAVDTNKEGHQHSNWEKWNRRKKNWFAFSLSCELSRSFLGLVQFREIVPEKTEDEKKTEKKVLFVNERWWWYYVIRTSRGGLTWAQISRPVQKQQHNVLYWPKDTYTQNKTNFRTILNFLGFFFSFFFGVFTFIAEILAGQVPSVLVFSWRTRSSSRQ